MLSDGVDNAVDLEALQAQIDLSMALTDQLVSSWLPKSATGKTNEKNGKTFNAELQDVLRRPARLGVGAPLPESTSGTTKEILRLKSKLSGKSKRKFGDDNENSKADHDLEDDEGRGKGGESTMKRIRLDPFSTGQGRRKAKINGGDNGDARNASNEIPSNSQGLQNYSAPPTLPDFSPGALSTIPANDAANGSERMPENEVSHTSHIAPMNIDSSQIPTKRKKKRKKKKKNDSNSNESVTVDVNHKAEGDVPSVIHNEPENLNDGSPPVTTATGEPQADPPEPEWHGFESSELDDDMEASVKPSSEPRDQSRSTIIPPLLCLNGPPPPDNVEAAAETSASTKKRRRKRRKKSASTVAQNDLTSNS